LSNLAWNSRNQDTIGKLLPQLIDLCNHDEEPVRSHATNTLANALFYHEGNRRRFGLYLRCITTFIRLIADKSQSNKVLENACRVLGSATHNDAVALQAGTLGAIPLLVHLSQSRSVGVQRASAFALGNLAVHDVHKRMIIEANGIESMTKLSASDCRETAKYAKHMLDILADLSRSEEIEAKRVKYGVQGLLYLCEGVDEYDNQGNVLPKQPGFQALACDELAIEATKSTKSRLDIVHHDGHKILVTLLSNSILQKDLPEVRQVQQRSLWALRSITKGGDQFQDICGANDTIDVVVRILKFHFPKVSSEDRTIVHDGLKVSLVQSSDVCEASLGFLFALCSNHEKNSRRTIQRGLKTLLLMANESDDALRELVVHLLEVMGPYSWIVCSNCKSKEKGGSCCSKCGHTLRERM